MFESFANAATGQQHYRRARLANEFIWNLQGEVKTKLKHIATSRFNSECARQQSILLIKEIQSFAICCLNFGLTKKNKKSQLGSTDRFISIPIV